MEPHPVPATFPPLPLILGLAAILSGCANFGDTPGNASFRNNFDNARQKDPHSINWNIPRMENTKRGNTPPGMDRAGNTPGSGAIVDPAGVLSR